VKPFAASWLLALTIGLFSANASAEEQAQGDDAGPPCDFCKLGKTIGGNVRDVFTEPTRWQGRDWGSVAWKSVVVAGSIALLDQRAHDYLQRHRSDSSQRIADLFEPFGAEYALGTLAGFAIVGAVADKPTARAVAVDGTVSSIIASGLIVTTLKKITGRSRPNTGNGPHDFNPFNGGESFPSGHTAEAFTVATSIAENYHRPWISGLSYGIAGLVGYARMEHDAHWLSDVTASAFIGIGVAKHVAKANNERRRIAIVPFDEQGVRGIRIATAF
jgi:membrane-associated phospholipid phosphatase